MLELRSFIVDCPVLLSLSDPIILLLAYARLSNGPILLWVIIAETNAFGSQNQADFMTHDHNDPQCKAQACVELLPQWPLRADGTPGLGGVSN